MKKLKRLCSLILCMVMLVSLLPVSANAEDLLDSVPVVEEKSADATESITEDTTTQEAATTEETEAVEEVEIPAEKEADAVEESKAEDAVVSEPQEAVTEEPTSEEVSPEDAAPPEEETTKEVIEEEEIESLKSADHPKIGQVLSDGSWAEGTIWYVYESHKASPRHYVFCMDRGVTMYSGKYDFKEVTGKFGAEGFRMAVAMNYFKAHGGWHDSTGYADTQRAVWNSPGKSDTAKHLINYANSLYMLSECNSARSVSGLQNIKESEVKKNDFSKITTLTTQKVSDADKTTYGYNVYNKKITINDSAWKYFAGGAGGWGSISVEGCYKVDENNNTVKACDDTEAVASVDSNGTVTYSFNSVNGSYGYDENHNIAIVFKVNQTYSGSDTIEYLDCGTGKQRLCSEMKANSPAYFAVKVWGKNTQPDVVTVNINKVDELGNPLPGAIFWLWPSTEWITIGKKNSYEITKAGDYYLYEVLSPAGNIPQILKTGIHIVVTETDVLGQKILSISNATTLPAGFSVTATPDNLSLTYTIPNSYAGGSAYLNKTGDLLLGYKNGRFTYEPTYLQDVYFKLYTGEDIYMGGQLLFPANTEITQAIMDASIWVTQGGVKVRDVSIPEKTGGTHATLTYSNLPPGRYYMVEDMDRNTYQRKFFPDNIDFVIKRGSTTAINGGTYTNKLVTAVAGVKKVCGKTGSETPLAGAEFTLYASVNNKNWRDETYFDIEDDTAPAVTHRNEDGTATIEEYKWVPLESKVSDTNGNATFDIEVPYGDYMIVETKAPDGYSLSFGDSLKFTHKYDATADYSSGAFYHFVVSDEESGNMIMIHKEGELLTGADEKKTGYGSYNRLKFGKVPAKDIVFEIYDAADKLVDTVTTGDDGTALSKNLPVGVYKVKEVDNGGIMKMSKPKTVEIKADETKKMQITDVFFENTKLSTSFKIYKQGEVVEKSTGTEDLYSYPIKPLGGVVFGVYTKDDIKDYTGKTIVTAGSCVGFAKTDDTGVATFDETLINGSYYFGEVETSEDKYIKDEGRYDFTVKLNGENLVKDLNASEPVINYLKKGSIKVVKTDGKTQKPLKGVEFALYDNSGEELGKYLTDDNGEINITRLPISTYYIQETKAPKGYKLDDTMHVLTMTTKTYDLTLTVKNYKNKTAVLVKTLTRLTGGGTVKTGDISRVIFMIFFISLFIFMSCLFYKVSKKGVLMKVRKKLALMLALALCLIPVPKVNAESKTWFVVNDDKIYERYCGDDYFSEIFPNPNSEVLIYNCPEDQYASVDLSQIKDGDKLLTEKGVIINCYRDSLQIQSAEKASILLVIMHNGGRVEINGTYMDYYNNYNTYVYSEKPISCYADNCIVNAPIKECMGSDVCFIWDTAAALNSHVSSSKFIVLPVMKSFNKDYHITRDTENSGNLEASGRIDDFQAFVDLPSNLMTKIKKCDFFDSYMVFKNMSGEINLKAQCNVTLNYIDDSGEKSSTHQYEYGSEYGRFSIPKRKGYTFKGLIRDDGKEINEMSLVDVSGDHVINATYSVNKYVVTFDADGGETDINSKSVAYNSIYGNLPKARKEGYTFKGWYLDGKEIKSSDKMTLINNHTLKAEYDKLEAVSYSEQEVKNTQTKEQENINTEKVATVSVASIKPGLKSFKLQNKSKRKVTVKLSGRNVTGYQIQYDTDRSFATCKTVETESQTYKTAKLKKKRTYYFRVRAYCETEAGERIYSDWSAVSKIKIKK